MMKKIYVTPELEIEKFTLESCITTSISGDGQGGADEDLGEF